MMDTRGVRAAVFIPAVAALLAASSNCVAQPPANWASAVAHAPADRRPRSARRGSAFPARARWRRQATGAGGCRAADRRRADRDRRRARNARRVRRCGPPPSRCEMEQAGVQVQVLPHRQLGVEREGLRHVADAARAACPRRRSAGRTARPAPRWRGSRPRQHLHRRRLAAAVGAEEAEDLAALDPRS